MATSNQLNPNPDLYKPQPRINQEPPPAEIGSSTIFTEPIPAVLSSVALPWLSQRNDAPTSDLETLALPSSQSWHPLIPCSRLLTVHLAAEIVLHLYATIIVATATLASNRNAIVVVAVARAIAELLS